MISNKYINDQLIYDTFRCICFSVNGFKSFYKTRSHIFHCVALCEESAKSSGPQAAVGETDTWWERGEVGGRVACVCMCLEEVGVLLRDWGIFSGVLMVSPSPQRLAQMSGQL